MCVCVRGYKRAYNIEIEMNFVFLVATSRQNLLPHNIHQHPQAKLKSKQKWRNNKDCDVRGNVSKYDNKHKSMYARSLQKDNCKNGIWRSPRNENK